MIKLSHDIDFFSEEISFEKIVVGGEKITYKTKSIIENKLKNKFFFSVGYTSNDAGATAFQCKEQHGTTLHHIHELAQYEELIYNQSISREHEKGSVLLTNLFRTTSPILRYEIGDSLAYKGNNCKCGRKSRVYELIGRHDSLIRIDIDGDIYLDVFQKEIEKFEFLNSQFQIELDRIDGYVKLIINFEKTDKNTFISEIENENFKKHIANFLEYEFFLEKNTIKHLEINILEPNSLKRIQLRQKLFL